MFSERRDFHLYKYYIEVILIVVIIYFAGDYPSNDVPEGDYPTIVEHNGHKVLIVQSFWAGKYLGFLNVSFNDDGDVESWIGEPILLNNSIPKGISNDQENCHTSRVKSSSERVRE